METIVQTARITVRCYPPAETPVADFPFVGELVDIKGQPHIRHGGAIDRIDRRWVGYSFERIGR